MTEQHKAPTWDHWAELTARVEALVAARHAHVEGSHDRCLEIHEYRPSMPTTPSPAGSLVERVEQALERHHVIGDIEGSWDAQARAAICEVAAWLGDLPGWEGSTLDAIGALLKHEATR